MATPLSEPAVKPRIGLPYRTKKEELTFDRGRYQAYLEAIKSAGGEPVEISLRLAAPELSQLAHSLDGFVLPGSPSDVDPGQYGTPRHAKCADSDPGREHIDFALLDHAFTEHKPVLAICYGIQSLNVFLGGSLIQDIASEWPTTIQHSWDRTSGAPEPFHAALAEPDTRLYELARAGELRVNSSHHQAIRKAGRGLRVAARAPDGIIEAVEWIGDANWVTGVQWHPERMFETDRVARSVFETFVSAARAPVPPRVS
jgi:putative glutamine amidotransferase